MSSKRYVIYVSPSEWGIVEPIKTISDYIKSSLKRRGMNLNEVSDHQITRIFPHLERFLQGHPKTLTISDILDTFSKQFGFANEEEKNNVQTAVARLVDRLSMLKRRDPVRVYKLIRSLRTLLIGFVRGYLSLPIQVYEKQSEKAGGEV